MTGLNSPKDGPGEGFLGNFKSDAPEVPKAIIVRTPNWLGDLMMSTAFLDALLSLFPQARLDLIVRKGFEVLPLPHRGEIITFDKNKEKAGNFGRGLRGRNFQGHSFQGQGFTHFFVLPPSFSSAWMAYRSRVPTRIGYGGGGRGLLLRPALPYQSLHRSAPLVGEYLGLLSPWKIVSTDQFRPRLPVDSEWIAAHLPPDFGVLNSKTAQPYVVLAPGAEFGPAKQWPIAHYRATAQALSQAGYQILVTGMEQDQPQGERIIEDSRGGMNLCGKTDLTQLTALIAAAGLVISNDSGAMHIAAALHRPQIALFGSSNPAWTAPLNPLAHIFYRELSCSPCYKPTCPLGHTECLNKIPPEKVVEKALLMLEEKGKRE